MISVDQEVDSLVKLLSKAIGPDAGITIDTIAERLSLSRRSTEILLQTNLANLPFVVVADSHGYYRPTDADQINAYIHSLRHRHMPLKKREEITQEKASAEGFELTPEGIFKNSRAADPDLFAWARRNQC
jgi:hypothetical protein